MGEARQVLHVQVLPESARSASGWDAQPGLVVTDKVFGVGGKACAGMSCGHIHNM